MCSWCRKPEQYLVCRTGELQRSSELLRSSECLLWKRKQKWHLGRCGGNRLCAWRSCWRCDGWGCFGAARVGCVQNGRQGAASTRKQVCSSADLASKYRLQTFFFWRTFLTAVWKESIIGNKELVIHLTRTFHLSLSQRHSCLILWIAVAQQTCRVLIVKWILMVFFFPPPPYCFN